MFKSAKMHSFCWKNLNVSRRMLIFDGGMHFPYNLKLKYRSCYAIRLWYSGSVFPISAKKCEKCEIFSGIFALKFCEFRRFFSRQKPAFLFPAKNRRQPRFTAPPSGMSQKSRRKVAEIRRRTFFFFGDLHKIGEKDAFIGVMTFFFLEITF